MAKIKTKTFHIKDDTGSLNYADAEKIIVDLDIYVDAKGTFYTKFESELADRIKSAGIKLYPGIRRTDYEARYVYAPSMEALDALIREMLTTLITKKHIKTERVIKYSIVTSCSYFKLPDGSIEPNGVNAPSREYDGWIDGTTGTNFRYNDQSVSLSIAANVFDKHTYQFAGGREVCDYEKVTNAELNKYIQSVKQDNWKKARFGDNVMEMPYTEQNEQFFIMALRSIFNINEQIGQLSKDPEAFMLAINNGKLLKA